VNLTVRLQKIAIALTKMMPLKLADLLAAGIGALYMSLLKDRRKHILKNLRHVFSDKPVACDEYNHYMKRTFVNFALCMTDFFRLAYLSNSQIASSYEGVGLDNALEALKHKRGCVLVTLHIGNWDYAGACLAALGYPMNALVEETEPEMFELYTHHRERTGLKCYPLSRSAYAFIDTIKNNRILAVLADRDVAGVGVPVKFFSGRRKIPENLATIIVRKKMPVVFAYMVLNPSRQRRYLGVIEPYEFFDDIERFNQRMVAKFEEIIARFPDQWFVFHPEWVD
jgi:KDO2-lipid IV(A) lauroyltransferase